MEQATTITYATLLANLELVTVIGSDLFSQDEYIKEYLLDPDLPLIFKIKIGLRYYITPQPELILQLTVFKGYLEKVNPFLFFEVFGKHRKVGKSGNSTQLLRNS